MAFELEVCVDSVASALTAAESGATRLEVCADLAVGGLTPSFGLLQTIRQRVPLPIMVLVRPRAGDFCYTDEEVEAMVTDITLFRQNGAHGFVIGALTREGDVDMHTCQWLLVSAGPQADTTFHRAFDVARNPQTALEQVIELGFRRLLTSGQAASVEHDLELLARLASQVHPLTGRVLVLSKTQDWIALMQKCQSPAILLELYSETNLEVCVDSVASALTAAESGATRLEVCAGLAVGGLTPSFGLFQTIRQRVPLPIMVLVRPRAGDFCYTDEEVEAMVTDITLFRQNGAHGFVIGALTREGDVDMHTCQRLLVAAGPQADTTFHRAFDVARNPQTALEQVIELGFRRLLTSGQAASVEHGLELLARLASQMLPRPTLTQMPENLF